MPLDNGLAYVGDGSDYHGTGPQLRGARSPSAVSQVTAENAIIKIKVTGQGSIVRTIASTNLRCGIQMGKILAA
jgi:hypothetical protein